MKLKNINLIREYEHDQPPTIDFSKYDLDLDNIPEPTAAELEAAERWAGYDDDMHHTSSEDPEPALAEQPPLDEILVNITPNNIIDRHLCKHSYPLMYDATNDMILVGKDQEYHSDIFVRLMTSGNRDTAEMMDESFRGYNMVTLDDGRRETTPAAPGLVGRIGKGLVGGYDSEYIFFNMRGYDDLEIVSIYAKPNTTAEIVKKCVANLIRQNTISPDAKVVFAKQISTAGELANIKDANEEQIRLGRLQVALHLGAWPDGRRLTPKERQAIEKELWMTGRGMKKHPMQQSLEQNKLAVPGQKWWAPTSESKAKARKAADAFHKQLKAALGQL